VLEALVVDAARVTLTDGQTASVSEARRSIATMIDGCKDRPVGSRPSQICDATA
jgi:hypothetical protein